MPLNIIRNDITRVAADAIVNTANPYVAVGRGVDSAIYGAAGWEELLKERGKIGRMRPGHAAATPAFALDARYIIHTVGPAWQDGSHGELETLANCYRESLRIAGELHCESVAFPLISTGTYGFPKDKALQIAVSEISAFLFSHEMTVYLVVYDKEAFVISGKAFSDIQSFIDEADIVPPPVRDQKGSYKPERRREERRSYDMDLCAANYASEPVYESLDEFDIIEESAFLAENDLQEILDQPGESFQEMLFRIIDRKGMTDPEVYHKANIDRKLFSKIRSFKKYTPSKKTVLALAVALELNLDETVDLLQHAGLALNPSNRFDLIVGYCIAHKIYNVHVINTYLFDYDEPLLVG